MDIEKDYRHSNDNHDTLKELRRNFLWGRLLLWCFATWSVIVTSYAVYSFPSSTWHEPPVPSLASCVRTHPESCASSVLRDTEFQIREAAAIDPRSASNAELATGSLEELHHENSTHSVALTKRIDWKVAKNRYGVAMAPVTLLAGAMNLYGIASDCQEWHTDKETGETTKVTNVSAFKCVGNAITTGMLFLSTAWGGAIIFADIRGWFLKNGIHIVPCCSKRDQIGLPKDFDPADMQRISETIGYPVSHLGRHYHSFGSNTTNDTHHTHYSHVFSLDHPKGPVHFAYMGNDTDGNHILKFGFGSGKEKAATDSTIEARSSHNKYNYYNMQGFSFGSGIMIKGKNNPDGIAADAPGATDPNWAWDAIHARATCYLNYNWYAGGWQFQVYDYEYEGTAFAGALAPFSLTKKSQIRSIEVAGGLIEWPQCSRA